jgi:hypothetical protein
MLKKTARPEILFVNMTSGERVRFLGKALVFFASGGFIFPTIWVD